MAHSGKNFRQHNKFTVGGELEITSTGTLTIKSGATLSGLPQAANVAEAAGDNPTAAEFKALLDALIAAGLMKAPATTQQGL